MPVVSFAKAVAQSLPMWQKSKYFCDIDGEAKRAARLCAYSYMAPAVRPSQLDKDGHCSVVCDATSKCWSGCPKCGNGDVAKESVTWLDEDIPSGKLRNHYSVYYTDNTHGGTNKVEVAIRGTDLVSWSDLNADIQVINGIPWDELHQQAQFKEALDVVKEVAERYAERYKDGAWELHVHGHSLGGTKAVVAAMQLECIKGGFVFNPGSGAIGTSELAAVSGAVAAGVAVSGAVAAVGAWSVASAAAAQASSAAAASWFPTLTGAAATAASSTAAAGTAAHGAALAVGGAAGTCAKAWAPITNCIVDHNRELKSPGGEPTRMHAYHVFGDVLSATYPFKEALQTFSHKVFSGEESLLSSRHAVVNFIMDHP